MTKTPKTDAAMFYQPSDRHTDEVVSADFARQLEEENLTLREAAILVTESFFKTVSLFERMPVTCEMEATMLEIENTIKTATLKLRPFLQ